MVRPVWLTPSVAAIIAAGAVVMSASLGARQPQGLLLDPLSIERGWPFATFSLAVALQNLLWGVFQPFAGAAADRWGAARVAALGAVAYAIGLVMMVAGGPAMTVVGLGVVAGAGIAATTFSVVLGTVGRAVEPRYRSSALGLASAAGSFGMMLAIPLCAWLIRAYGPDATLLVLAALCLGSIPFAWLLGRAEAAAGPPPPGPSLREALKEAVGHSGYRLLILGFFVCGFQIAYIAVHLPNYLQLCGMGTGAGATALLTIGLFNVLGSWLAGQLGGRFRSKYVLSAIYLLRVVAVVAFVWSPKSETALIAFTAAMGLLWLSTVPLTSGLVALLFGPKHMGSLFGIVFLSHQIGAFVGSWAGGEIYDATLSYEPMWIATAALGLLAAVLHLPIADRTPSPIAESPRMQE
jgi:predicted MFS family arabinose efflux permease